MDTQFLKNPATTKALYIPEKVLSENRKRRLLFPTPESEEKLRMNFTSCLTLLITRVGGWGSIELDFLDFTTDLYLVF